MQVSYSLDNEISKECIGRSGSRKGTGIDKGICKGHEVEIIRGHVSRDHIHLFVSVPPHLAISKLVQYLKGKSSYKLLMENKGLPKEFWGRHIWGRGYFVATSGNITDEVIMEYIEKQDQGTKDDGFTVTDGL